MSRPLATRPTPNGPRPRTPIPRAVGALRSILRIRPFRRLWLVLGVASLGDWLGLLATSIFAPQQVTGPTAQGLAFGGVIAVRLLPALVLGPIAGVLADRFDRRLTMVFCDLVRFVLFASIPIAALFTNNGAAVIAWTAIATFLIEAVTMAWLPAKDAAVPNLLPKGRLETANQLTLATTYGVTPVAAALLLAGLTKGLSAVYALDRPELPQPDHLLALLPGASPGWPPPSSSSSASRRSPAAAAAATQAAGRAARVHRRLGLCRARPRWSAAWCWASWPRSAPAAWWSAARSSTPGHSAAASPPSTSCSR